MLTKTLIVTMLLLLPSQDPPRSPDRPTRKTQAPTEITPESTTAAIADSVTFLLKAQEGPNEAEWPYEGVYRVRGEGPREFISRGAIIPMGYRVGGTSIAGMALLRSTDQLEERNDALERARQFVVKATESPDMAHEYGGGYDVRGWGYFYGARFLMAIDKAGLVPQEKAEEHEKATRFYVTGIEALEIPVT